MIYSDIGHAKTLRFVVEGHRSYTLHDLGECAVRHARCSQDIVVNSTKGEEGQLSCELFLP